MKKVFAVSAILILAIASLAALLIQNNTPKQNQEPKAYVGVTYCGNSVKDAKLLVDKVKNYTNLLVLQSGSLQRDLKSVDEIGNYAVSAGLYFLPYFGSYLPPSFSGWLENATAKWGNHLLGVYYDDEPGGKMLDDYVEFKDNATGNSIMKTTYGDIVVQKPDGVVVHYEISGPINLYEPAAVAGNTQKTDVYATFYPDGTIKVSGSNDSSPSANQTAVWSGPETYESLMNARPFKNQDEVADRFYARNQENVQYLYNLTRTFTSDYALYWFDYQIGYNVMLAQIGWNNSFAQNIALIRGAANLQSKDWGIMITWKYNTSPYFDSGTEIFSQMRTAYESGAKYIIVFNYYEDDQNPYGTMKDEHFAALENFWISVVKNSSEIQGSTLAEEALVLPKNYACGLRWEGDRIWGVQEANETSLQIWNLTQKTLSSGGFHFDIVYEDLGFPVSGKYQQIIYWNQTG